MSESDGCPMVGIWVRGQSSMFGSDLQVSIGRINKFSTATSNMINAHRTYFFYYIQVMFEILSNNAMYFTF